MSLTSLINKTTKAFVNMKSGEGISIDYKHAEVDETIPNIMVSAQAGNYLHLNEERSKNSMSFMAVFLDIKPEKNDIIYYNNIEWKVELFDGTNPYDIVAYNKQKSIATRPLR